MWCALLLLDCLAPVDQARLLYLLLLLFLLLKWGRK